ncbi:ATP-dependent DNA helicase [Hydrogenophaga sp. PAMC20947]|nr:ATP-dependent DNA helicase [Hydrogenophaga sp. PAMC20947]
MPGAAAHSAVAVRALCEFSAKAGDLDLRFTPSPSGAEGVAGHSTVTARRPAGYQRELPLSARFEELTVTGRADGFDPEAKRVEEIKTHRGDEGAIPPNHRALHWAQARVYGWMLCQQLSLEKIDVALVYFNIDTAEETLLTETQTAADLRVFFENLCQRYIVWAREQTAHRLQRDAALRELPFPFPDFRPGQRHLTETVYRAQGRAKAGERILMAQAPTGIGKTMATLFGALKATPAQGTDKVFYLTAKTPGRQLALDALKRLNTAGHLRVLERVARDKACEHPDKACHGASCPLAQGFYDRLPEARSNAARIAWMDKATLRDTALAHSVCPYYLGQEMVRWSDVLVGDFNHYFDHGAAWHALTEANEWRVSLLIDEAHNLIERARLMHSAAMAPGAFQSLRQSAPPGLKKALDALHRRWGKLAREHTEAYEVLPELPSEWVECLQATCTAIGEHFVQHPFDATGALQNWWFEALHFLRVAESFGEHSLCDVSRDAWDNPRSNQPGHPTLSLRCVIPAPLLQDHWATAHSATLFSATLAPMDYVADLLGLPEDTTRLEVPSPFSPEQLQVRVAPHISTRWSHRQASLTPMADVMAEQFEAEPGNYLAFFSSFDYLQQALDRLQERHRFVPTWAQSRGMTEPDREAFINRFTEESQGIGFAVLGGAFGEGIDLPGHRLIGAFIATLGLPQLNPVNEQMRARLQQRFGRGYDYAYLYPGLQKVVQAAGRVIRSETDHGTVWLMDDRFGKAEVKRLLPAWWARS